MFRHGEKMKSRVLIIISIVVAVGVTVSLGANLMSETAKQRETELNQSHLAHDPITDPICLVTDKASSGETGSAVTMERCFTLSEFEEIGCTKPMLEHILRHSNLLDYEVDGFLYLDWAGLPSGVSQGEFEECYDAILEKRPILNSKNQDESKICLDGQIYNEVLFKCVVSCEDDLVYNGYTDSCTTEFELKYHGYCNEGLTYSPSLHVCLGNDPDIQTTPLKDPPRTAPPEPEPIPDFESLQRQKQQQAKLDVQKWVLTDTRDRVNQINAIREYRDEFEPGYFLEQFIHPIKQNYEKDKLMNFIYGEWGFQPTENTSPKVTVYFRSYENYDMIEKINDWQKPKDDTSIAISHDSDGFLLMGLYGMTPATGTHETCVVPGEYRVSVSNPYDESKVAWGYFTCQNNKIVGEPQPWMEIPE